MAGGVRPPRLVSIDAEMNMPTWQVDVSETGLPTPSCFLWRRTSRSPAVLRLGTVLDGLAPTAPQTVRVRVARAPRDLERLAIEATAERPVIALTTPEARHGTVVGPNNACMFLPLDDLDPSRVGGLVLRLVARGEAWLRCRDAEAAATGLASKLLRQRNKAGHRSPGTARLDELRLRHILEVRGGPWSRVKPELHLGVSRSSLRTWIPSYVGSSATGNRPVPRLRVAWRGGSPPHLVGSGIEFLRLEDQQPFSMYETVDAVVFCAWELGDVQALEWELGRHLMPPLSRPLVVLTSFDLACRFTPYVSLGLDVFVTSNGERATTQEMDRVISRLPALSRLARLENEIAELRKQVELRLPFELGDPYVSIRELSHRAAMLTRSLGGTPTEGARMLGVDVRTFAQHQSNRMSSRNGVASDRVSHA